MQYSTADTVWIMLGTALVFFMQAGFAMLEAGFTRSKNAGNIVMKNLLDFCLGAFVFWLFGYGIMYGNGNAFIGVPDLFSNNAGYDTGSVPLWCHVMFSTVFCATAATIVSGAMAERTKFSSYLLYSIIISAIVFPVIGHWVWGGGWLSTLSMDGTTGYLDFAGSSLVHLVGGTAALIGAKILGPRIGKYGKDGKPRAIPGHSITLGALGIFILWFGWFGFNSCSSRTIEGDFAILEVSKVLLNTNLVAVVSTISAMLFTWIRYKKPDISMTLNASLAGLVASAAGCAYVNPQSAVIIGLISGILTVGSIEFIDRVLKIDDPVGAIGVHGINGLWGALAVGLFSETSGVFTTGNWGQLKIQLVGCLAIIGWVMLVMIPVFTVMRKTIGLRVSREAEIAGLDSAEHNLEASYADFAILPDQTITLLPSDVAQSQEVPPENAIPVQAASENVFTPSSGIYKITILCKQDKFDALKAALDDIGITGITVTQVLGCGTQKGFSHYYRGVKLDLRLLPKVKVEIVVSKVPVSEVIRVTRNALYTGNIGDGKIFISSIDDVVRVRTGVSGYNALQDDVSAQSFEHE